MLALIKDIFKEFKLDSVTTLEKKTNEQFLVTKESLFLMQTCWLTWTII